MNYVGFTATVSADPKDSVRMEPVFEPVTGRGNATVIAFAPKRFVEGGEDFDLCRSMVLGAGGMMPNHVRSNDT